MKTKHIILTLMQTLVKFALDVAKHQPTDREALKALSALLTEVQLTIIGELEPEVAAEARRLMAEGEVEAARESCVGGVQ